MLQGLGHTLPPPYGGSLPSKLSLREGSEHRRQAGAEAPQESPIKWRYSILIFCRYWLLRLGFPLPALPLAR